MADEGVLVRIASDYPVKIVKWKVRDGAAVSSGQVLCLYEPTQGGNASGSAPGRCRAPHAGVVRVRAGEGDIVQPGEGICELAKCKHTTVMKQMCAECGADLSEEKEATAAQAIVPMVHSVPELKVTEELAKKLGREDCERLLRDRKLVLLVDLDQTLVHTTNENVPPKLKNVAHYWLRGPGPGGEGRWYHTRLRPGTRAFLRAVAARYELHVCTFGARQYAHAVAELLDPNGEYFSHRILSRDECFDARAKAANLKALFPCGDNMVCIIDDRDDVWRHATNLIHVRPYNFFRDTGDINAPPQAIEKSKVSSGRNGAQNAPNPQTEMPLLDPDPDTDKRGTDGDKEDKAVVKDVNAVGKDDKSVNDDAKVVNDDAEVVREDGETVNSDEKFVNDDGITVNNDGKIVNDDGKSVNDDGKSVNDDVKPVDDDEKDGELETEKEKEGDSKSEEKESQWKETEDGIDVEDPDDYLLYLEDILERIHQKFYEEYSVCEGGRLPDLKEIIPGERARVLGGARLVFSGLVPQHQRLESSRAYQVARALGAHVTQDFTPATTHLLAARPGTVKVNAGRRLAAAGEPGRPRLHVVTPEWLWACAERWQHVDERLYPLQRTPSAPARRPPPHCSSPPPAPAPAPRRRTPSGRFMDTLNPLLSFSRADIADMDKEVEDMCNESGESGSEDDVTDERLAPDLDDDDSQQPRSTYGDDSCSSASDDSLTNDSTMERPRKRRRARAGDDEPPDWQQLGEALEREILGLD